MTHTCMLTEVRIKAEEQQTERNMYDKQYERYGMQPFIYV